VRRYSKFLLLLFLPSLLHSRWLNEERLTNLEGGSFLSYNNAHCITTETYEIYLVWFDANSTSYYRSNIYYRKYDSGWKQVTKLTSSSFHSAFPSLIIDEGHKFLVWFEFPPSPLVNDSIAFDLWWCAPSLKPSLITPLMASASYSLYPSLTMDREDVLHLVWQDSRDGNFNIFYKYFKDNEWSSDTNLTPEGVGQYPCICAGGDAIYLVWQDSRSEDTEIYFKSKKGGVWTSDTALTDNPYSSLHPFIAADGNENVHLVWHDLREGTDRVFYKFYNGTIWSSDSCITPIGCDARYPQGVVDTDGNFHLVWEDSRSGECEIYYKKWSSGSGIWSEDTALTRYPALARQPHIASDGLDNLHVVWEDYRGDSTFAPEIYYKKYTSDKNSELRVQNLIQCYPNPFNSFTVIRYSLPSMNDERITNNASLKIYDASGRLVRTFRVYPRQHPRSSVYSVSWDGRDEKGKSVPSGVYFAMIRFDSKSFAKKICLIR